MNELDENNAIAIGQIQVLAESTLFDKGLNERELREWLLPICARQGLNSDTFEYLYCYLSQKLCH